MKITTMPTNTQEMVTIIFKPSPPPGLSSLTLGAFTKGAMVPEQKSYDVKTCVVFIFYFICVLAAVKVEQLKDFNIHVRFHHKLLHS